MLNHIVLMGRLTRDPELRYTGSNVPVASFSIAVDRDFGRGENGEKQTDFINVSAWRQTGEFVSKYFTKGSMIVVSGRLQMRDYTDRDGNRRTAAEVVAECAQKGVLVITAHEKVRLLPALNIPMELVRRACEVIEECVR